MSKALAAGIAHSLALIFAGCGPFPHDPQPGDAGLHPDASRSCSTASGVEPGAPVSVYLEGDKCSFLPGEGGDFRARIVVRDAIAYTAPSSNGGCGRCSRSIDNVLQPAYSSDPRSLVNYSVGAGPIQYCVCDLGCCAPTTEQKLTLAPGTYSELFRWPGREWNGPSDTSSPLGAAFPPGNYAFTARLVIPGVGVTTAALPIQVRGR
jgi:hypothetical protein